MNAREERGRAIAETQLIVQKGKAWLVPSQSAVDHSKYTVVLDEKEPSLVL